MASRAEEGTFKVVFHKLEPHSILRAVVYIQAAVRRFLMEDAIELLAITPTVPAPPVAVAVYFARRRRQPPSAFELEDEAMGVAAIICGRDRGLTLEPIAKAHDRYAFLFDKGHPVLEMLSERFHEVATEAEEDLLARLEDVELPSEGNRCLQEFRSEWGVPEQAPGGGELFERARAVIDSLKPAIEEKLTKHLDHCQSSAGFDALEELVERELGDGHPVLLSRLRSGKRSHRHHVEQTAQSLWGWPPVGSAQPLARAARWYAAEIGAEHPVVEDFAAAVVRLLKKKEAFVSRELQPFNDAAAMIRRKLNATVPPPKLMRESLEKELQEQMMAAVQNIEYLQQELGSECQLLYSRVRTILGEEALVLRCENEAQVAADVLERPPPGPFSGAEGAEQMEERLGAAVTLCQLQEALGSLTSPRLTEIFAQHEPELVRARPRVPLQRPSTPDSADEEGWHMPPGFDRVEQPAPSAEALAASQGEVQMLPGSSWPETPPVEPEPVPEGPEPLNAKLKLHGVTLQDTRCKSELLFLEKCAAIIAEECGIPREWVSHVAFTEPAPVGEPPTPELEVKDTDFATEEATLMAGI